MKLDRIFKLAGDRTRLRILTLLDKGELCVCQIMAVLDVSQSLISKNMTKLRDGGFLDERRDGKLVFYSIRGDLPPALTDLLGLIRKNMRKDPEIRKDIEELRDCMSYQKRRGSCDMRTFREYINKKKRRKKNA